MRKHAIVNDSIVSEIVYLNEDETIERSRYSLVIDIEDMVPSPEIGWILEGNKLMLSPSSYSLDEFDAIQQNSQRLFGEKLLKVAVDKIGARNLKLARENTPADIAALASSMASLKLLLEGGALKTVIGLCNAVKNNFPNHTDILQSVIDEISNFLNENGWE